MLPLVTVECRAVADPELRFSQSGMPIGNLRVVASSRKKDENDQWVDDKTLWLDVTCFKKLAENVAESISKSDLLVVVGRLQTEEWEKDGQKRSKIVLIADDITPSLKFKTATLSESQQRQQGSAAPAQGGSAPAQQEEPPF